MTGNLQEILFPSRIKAYVMTKKTPNNYTPDENLLGIINFT